jgi:SMC interacting uncharacterized protein involved in chromosome segregation
MVYFSYNGGKNMLENLVDKCRQLQMQQEKLEEEVKALKSQISEQMAKEGLDKYVTPSGVLAQLSEKETFKYLDEAAMVAWCESNNHPEYVQKKIVTTELNKELKKGMSLTESLKPNFTRTVAQVLTVKDSK